MYDRDDALRDQIAHVAITQLVSDIPSYGLNDKKMVEMTAFEEFGLLGRELGQPPIIHNYQVCARTPVYGFSHRANHSIANCFACGVTACPVWDWM